MSSCSSNLWEFVAFKPLITVTQTVCHLQPTNIQLLTGDHLARGSMKTAANCVSYCESRDYRIHRQVERTLRQHFLLRVAATPGRGSVLRSCLGWAIWVFIYPSIFIAACRETCMRIQVTPWGIRCSLWEMKCVMSYTARALKTQNKRRIWFG